MRSTFSYTFPFSVMQLSVFLVGSYLMLFSLPLPVREAYEASSLTFKAEVETLLWGSLWGYSSAKAQSFSSCFKRCPLLWGVRKMNRPCLFQGRKNAHTVQQSQIWSSNSNAFGTGQHSVTKQWQQQQSRPTCTIHTYCNLCLGGTEPQRVLPALLGPNSLLLFP